MFVLTKLAIFAAVAALVACDTTIKMKRQITNAAIVNSKTDRVAAETIASPVQSQAKYFQDFFTVQLAPYKIEFGHVCENPKEWEQRFERKDLKNHQYQGKVRWGDKDGGYGEHYWDYNHAGQGDDDHEGYSSDHYDSEHEGTLDAPQYDTQEDKETATAAYRAKRHPEQEQEDSGSQLELEMDQSTGYLVDKRTGKYYMLKNVH